MKNNKIIYATILFSLTTTLSAYTLTISTAYELSLDNSNEIKSSAYQIKASDESINQIYSKLYPNINFSASHSRTDFELNHQNYRFDNEYEQIETITDYTISLDQTIYNKDIFSKIDIEKNRSNLYKIKLLMQKKELTKEVLKVYLNILKSRNKIDLYKSFVEFNKNKVQSAQKKFEMNLSNKMDTLQSKVEYNSAKINLSKEKKLLKLYNLKLEQLINDKSFTLPKIVFKKLNNSNIELMKKTVVNNDNFSSNLNIQQAKLGVKISTLEIENASAGHYPTLAFNAKYTKYDSDDATTDYENLNKVSISLKVPLYTGGYTNSRVAVSKFKQKAAIEDLNVVKKNLDIQYNELYAIFNSSLESLHLYNESLASAQLYIESISLGFQNGLKSILDLNDAQNKLYEIKYSYTENMYEMLDAYVGLLIISNDFDNLKLIDNILN